MKSAVTLTGTCCATSAPDSQPVLLASTNTIKFSKPANLFHIYASPLQMQHTECILFIDRRPASYSFLKIPGTLSPQPDLQEGRLKPNPRFLSLCLNIELIPGRPVAVPGFRCEVRWGMRRPEQHPTVRPLQVELQRAVMGIGMARNHKPRPAGRSRNSASHARGELRSK